MAVIHVVLLKFKDDVPSEEVTKLWKQLLDLSTNCIHPETNKPYVKTSDGGKNISEEGMDGGLTHGFVFEFASVADRDHYVHKDPAHLAALAALKDKVADARVFDYVPGQH